MGPSYFALLLSFPDISFKQKDFSKLLLSMFSEYIPSLDNYREFKYYGEFVTVTEMEGTDR